MSMNDELCFTDILDLCSKCGADLEYVGLGEYKCSKCGATEYNDYGKVRHYLEKHPGATQDEVTRVTGVKKARIRSLIAEEKITFASNSRTNNIL